MVHSGRAVVKPLQPVRPLEDLADDVRGREAGDPHDVTTLGQLQSLVGCLGTTLSSLAPRVMEAIPIRLRMFMSPQ